MKASAGARTLIRSFEGDVTHAYKDTGGVLTIGVGHALHDEELTTGVLLINGEHVRWTKGLTEEQVDALLEEDLRETEDAIAELVTVPLTQNQYDALVSFVFNIGAGQFAHSGTLRVLNEGKYDEVPAHMMGWVYDEHVRINGLVRRREAEVALFTA